MAFEKSKERPPGFQHQQIVIPAMPKDFQFVGDEIYMVLSIVQCGDYEKICEGIYRLIEGPTAI